MQPTMCLVAAAEGDADAVAVAVPGMSLQLGEITAGQEEGAISSYTDVIVIENLVIPSCGPVQVKAAYSSFSPFCKGAQCISLNDDGVEISIMNTSV